MSRFFSNIFIPAYDACHNGLIVEFKLHIDPNRPFEIKTKGGVAAALHKNFNRIIEIMTSLKKSWRALESSAYLLESCNDDFFVQDAKSSSMALSIALINVCRAIQGQTQVSGLSGTGVLRIDGSFDGAHLEDKKSLAAEKMIKSLRKFITPQECDHIFSLESLINQYQSKES